MKSLVLKGSYKDIGRQLGEIYSQNGKIYNGKINKTLYKKQLFYYNKYYPEFLEELRGISEGGNYDYDKVACSNLTGEISWYKKKSRPSCTIFGVKNKFGTFVGRNYDWYPKTVGSTYQYINPSSYKFIAITDHDYRLEPKREDIHYYADDAINEKGLYIGLTFAHGEKISYGLASIHIQKLIIEKCKNISEALEVFNRVPVSCPKNFFIADKSGKMLVVEHASGKNYKIIEPENGVLIKTNHYLDPVLIKQDLILKKRPVNSTYVRYYELFRNINLIGVNQIRQKDITQLILDKTSYIRANSITSKTIWSLSMDMKKGKYNLYNKGRKKEKFI